MEEIVQNANVQEIAQYEVPKEFEQFDQVIFE
jgi:hypothetical protein